MWRRKHGSIKCAIILGLATFAGYITYSLVSQCYFNSSTNHEALIKSGQYLPNDACKLDEGHAQTDPNEQALHQVCEMTVRDERFTKLLGGMKRLVHLDLKGAAPKPSYLLKLFPLIKKAGATGLLIEYEDMFPYSGDLEILASGDAYSKETLKNILNAAKYNGLSVVPLVQTFGHMEFVLKHKRFIHLREVEEFPQVISPCANGTSKLLRDMLSQVLDVHPDSDYFHIGSDEVHLLGTGRCKEVVEEPDMSREILLLHHVKQMAEFVKKWNKISIMWDDMFRWTPLDILKIVGGGLVEPMIWHYTPEVTKYIPDERLNKYAQVFKNVWVASSFKGATGSLQYITDTFYHLRNHMAWLKVIKEHAHHINFRGIALTGWQRYDHFATLCELLPQAIPSLVICLQAAKCGTITRQMLEDISKTMLNMDVTYTLELQKTPQSPKTVDCQFPGSDIYKAVMQLRDTRYFLKLFEDDTLFHGWITKYHAKYNFFSPGQLAYLYSESKIPKMLKNLTEVDKKMHEAMPVVFYKDTLEEWLMVNVERLVYKLKKYDKIIWTAITKSPKQWPGRPFHNKNIQPSEDAN